VSRRLLEAQVKALEEEIGKNTIEVPAVALEMAIEESAEVQLIKTQLATKRSTLDKVRRAAAGGVNDASYRRLDREIKDMERSLALMHDQARPRLSERMRGIATLNRKDELTKLRDELNRKQHHEKIILERYQEKREELAGSGSKELELEFRRGELEREQRACDLIAERLTALKTEQRAPGPCAAAQTGFASRTAARTPALAIHGPGDAR